MVFLLPVNGFLTDFWFHCNWGYIVVFNKYLIRVILEVKYLLDLGGAHYEK